MACKGCDWNRKCAGKIAEGSPRCHQRKDKGHAVTANSAAVVDMYRHKKAPKVDRAKRQFDKDYKVWRRKRRHLKLLKERAANAAEAEQTERPVPEGGIGDSFLAPGFTAEPLAGPETVPEPGQVAPSQGGDSGDAQRETSPDEGGTEHSPPDTGNRTDEEPVGVPDKTIKERSSESDSVD